MTSFSGAAAVPIPTMAPSARCPSFAALGGTVFLLQPVTVPAFQTARPV